MEIIFREMPHTYDEVVMGHKLWFPESIESDVISATANIDGFTPLTAISRKYGWNARWSKIVETADDPDFDEREPFDDHNVLHAGRHRYI